MVRRHNKPPKSNEAASRRAISSTARRLLSGMGIVPYRPGDPITTLTYFEPGRTFSADDYGTIIPSIDKEVPLRVLGGSASPFSEEYSQRLLKFLDDPKNR